MIRKLDIDEVNNLPLRYLLALYNEVEYIKFDLDADVKRSQCTDYIGWKDGIKKYYFAGIKRHSYHLHTDMLTIYMVLVNE